MQKMRKRLGMMLIAAFVLICSSILPVKAEEYKYTVRFYSGQQGNFNDGREIIVFENLSYGDTVIFNQGSVALNNDSKYYVKGIRESGRDNNTVNASSFIVEGDRDYVVAYGLKGDMVAYTVNYVDLGGNELAPTDTYYGNVGDKPVIAFLYIEGYEPQAYNLTKTLVANEAENVFTFVYTPIDGFTMNVTTTKIVEPRTYTSRSAVEVIPGNRTRRTGQSMGRAEINNNFGDGTDNDSGNLGGNLGGANTPLDTIDLDDGMDLDGIDLDGIEIEDPAVPLADMKFNIGPIEVDARMLLVLGVIIASALVIVAASWWYWKPYRKKEKEENAQ